MSASQPLAYGNRTLGPSSHWDEWSGCRTQAGSCGAWLLAIIIIIITAAPCSEEAEAVRARRNSQQGAVSMPAMRRRRRPRQIRAPGRWTRTGRSGRRWARLPFAPMGFGRAPRRRWPAKGEAAQDMPAFFPGKFSILSWLARRRGWPRGQRSGPRGGATTSIPTYFRCLNTPTLMRTCLLIPESPLSATSGIEIQESDWPGQGRRS
jgi:hypothetical protein